MLHEAFFFSTTCNATATNDKHCKLRWTCYTQKLVSQHQQRIVQLFLQLATQHFVALQVGKMGCYTGNCFSNLQCNVCCLASCRKKMAPVTQPLAQGAGDTLDIFGQGCDAGLLIPLQYTRTCSAAFCDPILDQIRKIPTLLQTCQYSGTFFLSQSVAFMVNDTLCQTKVL